MDRNLVDVITVMTIIPVTFTFDNQQIPISLKSKFSDRQSLTLDLYLETHLIPSHMNTIKHMLIVDDATTRQAGVTYPDFTPSSP